MTRTGNPALDQAITQLNGTIAGLQARIRQLELNQRRPQLGNSSIDSGALTITSAGVPVLQVGQQDDGTFAVTSSSTVPPLPPSTPSVTSTTLGLQVTWDGFMNDGSLPLSDFTNVEIHISLTSGFTPSAADLHGTLSVPGNRLVTGLAPNTTYYVALVAQNMSGNPSSPSAQAQATTALVNTPHLAANAVNGAITQASYFGLNMVSDPFFTSAALNALRTADAYTTGSTVTWALGSGQAASSPASSGHPAQLALMPSTAPLWVNPGEQYWVSGTFTVTGACTLHVTIATNSGVAEVTQAVGGAGTYVVNGTVTIPGSSTSGYFRVSAVVTSGSTTVTFAAPVMQPATLFSPTIQGTDWITNASGAFYYGGTPGPNTLSVSVVPGTTSVFDPFGNQAFAGVTEYSPVIGGIYFAVNYSGLTQVVWCGSSQASWASQFTANSIQVSTSGTSITTIFQSLGGTVEIGALQSAGASTSIAYSNSLNLGFLPAGYLPMVIADNASITVTSSTATNCTTAISIPANDAQPKTCYRLSAWGTGTQGSTQQTLSFDLAAFGVTGGGTGFASTFVAANAGFTWNITGTAQVTSTGTGTAVVQFNFTILVKQSGASSSSTLSGGSTSSAATTTAAESIAFQAKWGSTTGAPTITCTGSLFERLGP
jgi:hypothetical protein